MLKNSQYDFSGWATKTNILCTDGRTIRRDAFKDCDGKTVPLVWQHLHNDPANVLGHAVLENRENGVYAYCTFNDSEMAKNAKEAVRHKDITALSIYANGLKQKGRDVLHGVIREVSLVLAGANMGAVIDCPILSHGDGTDEAEAIIYNDEDSLYLCHEDASRDTDPEEDAEDEGEEGEEEYEESEEAEEEVEHSADDQKESKSEEKTMAEDNRTVADVFNGLSEEEKSVVYYLIGQAIQSNGGGEEEMKHNAFEMYDEDPTFVIQHEDIENVFKRAESIGSLRKAFEEAMEDGGSLTHSVTDDDGNVVTYGIANLDYLFPDYKELNNEPDFIKRDDSWVGVFNEGVHKTPFARVKTTHANITMDEARAKGYLKGHKKAEEVFLLLRRHVDPQTIYKKQKFDRDDISDIAGNLDVIAYVKREMQAMLKEEIARASLIGDGRSASDPDKIFPAHIIPVYTDDPLYTIRIKTTKGKDNAETAKNALKDIIRNRKLYKGSGTLTAFMSEDWLSELLLLEDGFGHPLYKDEQELARKMRVSKIVTVPQMEDLTNTETGDDGTKTYGCMCIMLDLDDYNWGMNEMGKTSFFDDFDIDFNQYKYLYETRLSGMLTKPYSAMVVEVPEE